MREYGSEFDNLLTPDNYFAKQCNEFRNFEFLRSGREAISLALYSIVEDLSLSKCVVLLPSYICPSMVLPFERFPCDIHYYNLNINFTVDEHDLIDKFRTYEPSCILISNYFGLSFEPEILAKIKNEKPNVRVIYDITHVALSISQNLLPHVDYYVASLRKWFGIADGAFLLTNCFCNTKVIIRHINTEFSKLREESLSMKKKYLFNIDQSIKEKFKAQLFKAEKLLDTNTINSISELSMKKLNAINVTEIKTIRKTNFEHLWNEIKKTSKIELAIRLEEVNLNEFYFMLPLLLNNRDLVQKKISDQGLYTQVIWKIPTKARQCKNSANLSDRILCVPIDQRYNFWDIQDIMKIIIKTIQNDK